MRLVQALESKHGIHGQWPPAQYWANWKDECELATKILVNSEWSKQSLVSEGIPEEKITVVPLAYENKKKLTQRQQHPAAFNSRRRLKILFLGQVLIRKGIKELASAAVQMAECPVEWHIVGCGPQVLLDQLQTVPNVVVHGSVSREACAEHYLNADVFVLPTHSDGFAITQLEAFSYGLPVIASRFCGNAVDHLHNGIILDEVTADSIIAAIQSLLDSPELLSQFRSSLMESPPDFSISRLGKTLATLGEELTNQTEAASRD
ncbi:MAG: glycosyltransferase family 4 protein [Fuerstiella sp.]